VSLKEAHKVFSSGIGSALTHQQSPAIDGASCSENEEPFLFPARLLARPKEEHSAIPSWLPACGYVAGDDETFAGALLNLRYAWERSLVDTVAIIEALLTELDRTDHALKVPSNFLAKGVGIRIFLPLREAMSFPLRRLQRFSADHKEIL